MLFSLDIFMVIVSRDSHVNRYNLFFSQMVTVLFWGLVLMGCEHHYSSAFKCYSITVRSTRIIKYGCSSFFTSALVIGQPFIIYVVRACKCSSSCVMSHISCVAMHSGVSVHISIASLLRFMPKICLYLVLPWFCSDNQPAMHNCGSYCITYIFYTGIHAGEHVAVTVTVLLHPFLKMATNGLYSLIMLTSCVKE